MKRQISLVLLLCGWLLPVTGHAWEWDWQLQNSFTVQRNLLYRQADSRGIPGDDEFYAAYLNGLLTHAWNNDWRFQLEINSGEWRFDEADGVHQITIDRRPIEDVVFDNDFFIRQLLLDYQRDADSFWQLTLGKQRLQIAKGFLFDDFQWAANTLFDTYRNGGSPFVLDGAMALVDHESPYAQLRWRLPWSERESFGLFATGFWDRSNSLARIIENGLSFNTRLKALGFDTPAEITDATLQAVGVDVNDFSSNDEILNALLALKSDIQLYTVGAALNHQFSERLRLELLAMGQVADGELSHNTFVSGGTVLHREELQLKGIAYFFDIEALYDFLDGAGAAFFYQHSSGSSDFFRKLGNNETNSTFLAIRPYNRRATLFFGSGGIQGDLSSRLGAITSDDGRGVMAPGFRLQHDSESIHSEVRGVVFWAEQSVPTGNFYGYEIDLEGRFAVTKWLMLYLEGDLFNPGNYYDSMGLDSIWQVLGGIGIDL